jgi:predicted porin
MKKSLVAAAVLWALSNAALAQSSVTLSGFVDLGVIRSNGQWSMGGSNSPYNAFTISVTENLGGGLRASALLNHRFRANDGSVNVPGNTATQSGYFWRNSWVGLGGPFGDVRLGRILMPMQELNGQYEPWAGGDTVGNVHTGGIRSTSRSNNTIAYRSPNFSGLQLLAGISAAEGQVAGECGGCAPLNSERPFGVGVSYNAGPLSLAVAYDRNTADQKTKGVYGKYDFGVAAVWAQYERGDVSTTAEVSRWSISGSIPVGAAVFKVGYTRRADEEQKKLGAGVDYFLSKRTRLYSDIGKNSGTGFTALQKKTMFDVGMRHAF